MSAERWIDRQVREARERGDFDNLPGTGKPLRNVEEPYDELWWAREFIEREKVNILPDALRLRRDIERFRERLPAMEREVDVRAGVRDLNERVLAANSRYLEGPAAPVWPLDEERVVARWRSHRLARLRAATAAAPASPPGGLPEGTRPSYDLRLVAALAIAGGGLTVLLVVLAFA